MTKLHRPPATTEPAIRDCEHLSLSFADCTICSPTEPAESEGRRYLSDAKTQCPFYRVVDGGTFNCLRYIGHSEPHGYGEPEDVEWIEGKSLARKSVQMEARIDELYEEVERLKFRPTVPPAAPAIDSVENRVRQIFVGNTPPSLMSEWDEQRIQALTAFLESERPRIEQAAVDGAFALLSLECDDKMPVEQWQAVVFAMQTVKERMNGKQ